MRHCADHRPTALNINMRSNLYLNCYLLLAKVVPSLPFECGISSQPFLSFWVSMD